MKKILSTVFFISVSLLAADSAKVVNSDKYVSEGARIYQQNCAICHGTDGRKVPPGASSALAGRDAVRLALTIRAYRDQDNAVGTYAMHKSSEIMELETVRWSDRQIGAIAKYISGLE